jgi:hypothetical protein
MDMTSVVYDLEIGRLAVGLTHGAASDSPRDISNIPDLRTHDSSPRLQEPEAFASNMAPVEITMWDRPTTWIKTELSFYANSEHLRTLLESKWPTKATPGLRQIFYHVEVYTRCRISHLRN